MASNSKQVCSLALCAAFAISTDGCAERLRNDVFVRTVFAGYTYVGIDEAGDPMNRPPLPSAFRPGVRYLFFLPRVSADSGQWTTIKHRPDSAGAEVLRAPRAAGDLANISVGGPLFRIEFRYDGRRGVIANEMEPRIRSSEPLSRDWLLERYVLEFHD